MVLFIRKIQYVLAGIFCLSFAAQADGLKPYVLGDVAHGDMARVVSSVKARLMEHGFQIAGSYSPYPSATVIVATDDELRQAAARTKNGGFGVGERVAVTDVNGKLEVSYTNPAYIGTAYGMGTLDKTQAALTQALGHQSEFGSRGVDPDQLGPGRYHYALGMPYFDDTDYLARYDSYQAAVQAVERNLAAGKGGTKKVYRIDIPGKEVTVFGVGLTQGDAADKHIMDIIDYKDPRSTAHLPYELMVRGDRVIALPARYRIAVDFPDLTMFGKHGFTKIMSAPGAIYHSLSAVASP